MADSLGLLVTLMGFVPMLVSALIVEKYYTQFWDAFWNLYGLILVCLGLAISEVNPFSIAALVAVMVVLVSFVYYVFAAKRPDLMRAIGSSKIVLPFSIVVVVASYTGSVGVAIVIGIVCFIFLIFVYLSNSGAPRRRR